MGDVVELNNVTRLDIDPDRVLQKAIGNMARVVIVGEDKDGEFYFASSSAGVEPVLFDLEWGKRLLFKQIDELADE